MNTRTSVSSNPRAATTRPGAPAQSVPKLRYIVVTLSGIFSILGIQLLLSIAVSGGAYEIAALKGEMRQSHQQLQIVAEDISALNAPGTLAGLATAMGMVADNNPAYLRLSDGVVIGQAVPASAASGPSLYPVTANAEAAYTPEIVTTVMNAVTLSLTSMSEEIEEPEPQPVASMASAPVVSATVAVATSAPKPKFGGTIPSPVTR